MKSSFMSVLTLLTLSLVMVCGAKVPTAFGYNHDFRAIQAHTPVPPMEMLEAEIIKRQANEQFRQEIDHTGKAISTSAQTVNRVSSPFTNSGDPIKKAVLRQLSKSSRSEKIKIIQHIYKTDKSEAISILQRSGKTFSEVTTRLDQLDKAGTLATMAGALSGGDLLGAAGAAANSAASGAVAGYGAAYGAAVGAKLGGGAATLLAGPVGAPIGAAAGGAIGAVVGAVGGSVIYTEVIEPNAVKIGDAASNYLQDRAEDNEKKVRRVRTDFVLVYPEGRLSSTGYIDPKQLHQQAQQIRDQRFGQRIEHNQQLTLDEIATSSQMLTVPSLAGMTQAQAEQAAQAAGFTASVQTVKPAPTSDLIGKIYVQSPTAKSQQPIGSFMTITALSYDKQEQITMPSVIGMNPQKARGVLTSAGLTVPATGAITVGKIAPSTKLEFKVHTQAPSPGDLIQSDQVVALVLYGQYEQQTIPAVIGLGKLEAVRLMEAVGLVVATNDGDGAPIPEEENTVQLQSLTAGDPVSKQEQTVLLTLFSACTKSEFCKKNQQRYVAALNAKKFEACQQILDESGGCEFYESEVAGLAQSMCLDAESRYRAAFNSDNYDGAKQVLAENSYCTFYASAVPELQCSKNLAEMNSALRGNNWNQFKGTLYQSQNCSFYSNYLAMAQKAEKQSQLDAKQEGNRQQFGNVIGQIFGAALNSAIKQGSRPHTNRPPTRTTHVTDGFGIGHSTETQYNLDHPNSKTLPNISWEDKGK